MEANLNQFRLLTVQSEREANTRRGGNNRSTLRVDSQYGGRSSPASASELSGSGAGQLERDRRMSSEYEESAASGNSSPVRHSRHLTLPDQQLPGTDGSSASHPGMSSVAENESEADLSDVDEAHGDTERGLIGALHSLERTLNNHSQLMARRLKRDATNSKGPTSVEPVVERVPSVNGPSLPKTAQRGDKVTVYIRVVFLKIGEIDTLKENFMADAFIQARWREPSLDGQASQFQSLQHIEDIDWDKFWNPKLYVENNLGEPKETVWQTLMFNARGEATIYERRRIKGCFLENLELDEFPFDTQDLTLTITTERSESELDLEEDSSEISSINVQSFVDEQEWKLHSHVETWKRVSSKAYQNSKHKHPAFSTSCRASRRPGFFIWNIFLVMLFICSLTFATFSVELTIPQSRLQLSFILLLTTITFKFVVSQTLPRISYLTYLDKYILTSMGILCGVCVWHAVVPLFVANGLETAKIVDMWGLIVSGSTYFMFHICFFLYIYFVALKKRWIYDQKDRDHRERVKKLQRLQESTDGGSSPGGGYVTSGGGGGGGGIGVHMGSNMAPTVPDAEAV